MAQPVVIESGRAEWHKRSMETLGLQPVLCRTVEKEDGSYGLMPAPGTTGRDPAYGVWVDPPSAKFDRLAFRVPPDAVVLDVDLKPGGASGVDTLARLEAELGMLPPTQRLTSRGPDQGSGRLLFRVPPGTPVQGMEEWIKATYGGGLDILHIAHRFSMAPGDHNPNTGGSEVYCFGPDNRPGDMWHLDTWPMLPDEWVSALDDYVAENSLAKISGSSDSVVTTGVGTAMIHNALERVRTHEGIEGNGFRMVLLRAAKILGGFVGTLITSEEAAIADLTEAVHEVWGAAPDAGDLALMTDGLGYGMAEPFEIDDTEDFRAEVAGGPLDDIELPEPDPDAVKRRLRELVSRHAADRIFKAARAGEELIDGESGWDAADMDSVLAGFEGFTPTPEYGLRTDGRGLFYAGKTHSVYGDPGSGKSLVVQYECAQVLLNGGAALYVDYEDTALGIVSRLRSLGVPDAVLRSGLTYIRPKTALTGAAETAFHRTLSRPYQFAVVDGVTTSVRLEGLDNFLDSDVDLWHDRVLKAIAERTGAAVVSVDHVVKNAENRGRHPYGSQRKLGSLTGAAYSLYAHPLPSRGKVGKVALFCTKDRPGGVTPYCSDMSGSDGGKAADIIIDASDHDAPTRVKVNAPDPGRSLDQNRSEKHTEMRAQIVQILTDRRLSGGELEKAAGGRATQVREVLELLKDEGVVVNVGTSHRPRYTAGSDFLDDLDPDDLI